AVGGDQQQPLAVDLVDIAHLAAGDPLEGQIARRHQHHELPLLRRGAISRAASPRTLPWPSTAPRAPTAIRYSRRDAAAPRTIRPRSSPGCAPCADGWQAPASAPGR